MELTGHVSGGVVVFDADAQLPEGTQVRILPVVDEQRQEELDSLRGKIDAAAEQLDRGEGRPFDADRIRAEVARRLAAPVE